MDRLLAEGMLSFAKSTSGNRSHVRSDSRGMARNLSTSLQLKSESTFGTVVPLNDVEYAVEGYPTLSRFFEDRITVPARFRR